MEAGRLFEMEAVRPPCPHCGLPMTKGGTQRNGRQKWVCPEKERERGRRSVRISVGGHAIFLGRTPTLEAAQLLRERIKKEAPSAR